jgi:hypothetical protein
MTGGILAERGSQLSTPRPSNGGLPEAGSGVEGARTPKKVTEP